MLIDAELKICLLFPSFETMVLEEKALKFIFFEKTYFHSIQSRF
jgi:hypothetical protein